MRTLVLGTVALDDVKTPSGVRRNILGGSAVHFAMSARLFSRVNLAAVVGEDFPPGYLDFLRRRRIALTSLIHDRGRTFHWSGEYRGDLNSAVTLKTDLGVLTDFKPEISEEERDIRYVFLANVDPHIQRYLLHRLRSPKLVGLDSMNYWIHHQRPVLLRVLKEVDIYLANDQEARSLSGESNLVKAAGYLHRLGPRMVIIKKGEHGVLFYCSSFIFCLPAYPAARLIDPTGAGDTFAGGLMGYLAKSGRITPSVIRKAIAYATVAASFNVEGFGVERSASLKMGDLEMRLAQLKDLVSLGR
ncbi:MAG: PfkB family carbohydrate kinase [Candidatus Omnitrophota bacterium]